MDLTTELHQQWSLIWSFDIWKERTKLNGNYLLEHRKSYPSNTKPLNTFCTVAIFSVFMSFACYWIAITRLVFDRLWSSTVTNILSFLLLFDNILNLNFMFLTTLTNGNKKYRVWPQRVREREKNGVGLAMLYPSRVRLYVYQ